MNTKAWLKDIALLLSQMTYLPLPMKWRADSARLPQAMRFLPLLGLCTGAILYGCMQLLVVMPRSGAAAVLVGVELMAGGAIFMRDLMRVADGRSGSIVDRAEDMLDDAPIFDNETDLNVRQRRFDVGRAGLVWGLVRLVALYLIYLYLLRHPELGQVAVIAAGVCSRLLMCWLIYQFPAFPPSRLHRGMSGRNFAFSCLLSLLTIWLMLPSYGPSLFLGLLVAFMGVYLFASYRVRFHVAMDEPCYGAACAWSELLFLLGWIAVAHFL